MVEYCNIGIVHSSIVVVYCCLDHVHKITLTAKHWEDEKKEGDLSEMKIFIIRLFYISLMGEMLF